MPNEHRGWALGGVPSDTDFRETALERREIYQRMLGTKQTRVANLRRLAALTRRQGDQRITEVLTPIGDGVGMLAEPEGFAALALSH